MRIVIVDENAARSAIIESGLREAGYDDIVRLSEKAALLKRLEALEPDVVLIDLANPNRDSLEAMLTISRTVRRPVAMFVDQSDAAMIEAAVDAGVSAYIVDGLRKERVKAILDMAVSRFNAYERLAARTRGGQGSARRAQGDRARQGHSDEGAVDHGRRGLCAAAPHGDEREPQNRRSRAFGGHGGGAAAMTTRLRIGFLPLVDAALLIVAREEGFAEQEGLSLDLVREASWANLRDRLSVGLLDAAQMLAPAAIAATLGLGHLRVPIAAPAMLSLNGASITVSSALFAEMAAAAQGDLAEPKVAAAAFAKVAAARVAGGGAPPVLATVFTYSTHTLLIGAFLRLANLKPESDIPLVVLPPQYTAASLASGQIDGFCAGAPWNAVAVASGAGAIAAFGVDLMPDAPEKLLAMRADDVERRTETAIALTRATLAAAAWAEKAEQPRAPRASSRARRYCRRAGGDDRSGACRAHRGRRRPAAAQRARLSAHRSRRACAQRRRRRSHVEAMIAAGQVADTEGARGAARRVFRDDLFAQALKSAR